MLVLVSRLITAMCSLLSFTHVPNVFHLRSTCHSHEHSSCLNLLVSIPVGDLPYEVDHVTSKLHQPSGNTVPNMANQVDVTAIAEGQYSAVEVSRARSSINPWHLQL